MPEENRPCYNCDKRTVNCHCVCEDYKEYKNLLAEQNAEKNKENDKERNYRQYVLQNYRTRRWMK